MADVAITLPTGEAATVPQEDLSRALAAGATAVPKYAPGSDEEFVNSGLGQGLSGVLATGRAASGGATDVIFKNLAGLVGGKSAERDVAKAFSTAKEANPLADLAGETAGMFLGGGGLTAVGEAAEAKVAAQVGEGLLGKVAAGAGRGAAEGAYLGVQHQITEDTIGDGDHARSGEALFATTAKEALLGGAIGAATGAAGYGLGRLFSRGAGKATEFAEEGVDIATDERATKGLVGLGPYRTPSASAVDELVGAKGAAGLAKESAKAAEESIEALRKTGMTSEQAAQAIDGARRIADKAAAVEGATKEDVGNAISDWFAKTIGKNDSDAVAAMQRHYGIERGLRDSSEEFLRKTSSSIAKDLTSVFRDVEDVTNEASFNMKPQRMKRLMSEVDRDAARDAAAGMYQQIRDTMGQLGNSSEAASAKAMLKDIDRIMKPVLENAEADAADLFLAGDKALRRVRKPVPFGLRENQMTSELQRFAFGLSEDLRTQLRDEGIWGEGARAHARVNDAFSGMKSRRDDVARTLAHTLDRGDGGVRLAGGDIEKVQSMLRKLTGHETDAELEGVKSIEAFIDGQRQMIGINRDVGDLSASQLAKLEAGEKALNNLERNFKVAREEISANNRVRAMQLAEREGGDIGGLIGKGLGGVVGGIVAGPAGALVGGGLGGMIGNFVTRPMHAMGQLASVAKVVDGVVSKIRGATKGAVEGGSVEGAARGVARSAEATGKEIEHITALAGNPERMSSVIHDMFKGVAEHAPKIATEARATAMRAVTFLASEAPIALGSRAVFGMPQKKARYSDAQLASWNAKRDAAMGALDGRMAPEVIVGDLQKGRLNRDAIRTIEFVSPRLFAEMQQTAQEQITKMAAEGKLGKLTLEQQASIASLLKVPPGEIWKPDFMLMMQAAKSTGQQPQQNSPATGGASKRAIKLDTDVFETGLQSIEAR